jgi:hypothetical protein
LSEFIVCPSRKDNLARANPSEKNEKEKKEQRPNPTGDASPNTHNVE